MWPGALFGTRYIVYWRGDNACAGGSGTYMANKRFINRKSKHCYSCHSKQKLMITEKDNWRLGVYHCPKCNADNIESFVLVDFYEGGCRIVAKKIKAYDLFNKK